MASRANTKLGRPAGKGTVKTPGKDAGKGDKVTTNVLEIIPGKFNETDWTSLIENDETEDFIADIFDDIWKETSKQIENIYIRRQLLPFTLMMTEQALTSVIQWAFLERDEPEPPVNDNFWTEDEEPIPCTMDNWGEGVVPACREEHRPIIEESLTPVSDHQPSQPPTIDQIPDDLDQIQRPSTASSTKSVDHSDLQTKEVSQTEHIQHETKTKGSSTERSTHRSSIQQRRYNHDVLVIQTKPPKFEPLSDLFNQSQNQTTSTSSYPTPATITTKRRRFIPPKVTSQLGSDALASTTNVTETTKVTKRLESKLFDEQRTEQMISKAPIAAQSMLKSILSRPPGYRELELDENGDVISIAKLDLDKIGPRSVRVKCDIVKPRKSNMETRSVTKPSPSMKVSRSEPRLAPLKIVLPEKSTDVGDLIQPVPGVLYEDSRLKKGDPRRYRNGILKYASFYDDTRPLRPIARRSDLAMIQSTNDLLHKSKDYNDDSDNEDDLQISKLHRRAPIPPIMSPSNTSSA